jgi:hypothetical protein
MKRSRLFTGRLGRWGWFVRRARTCPLAIEPLEGRQLLSGGTVHAAKAPIPNPGNGTYLKIMLDPSVDPGGSNNAFTPRVTIDGYAYPGSTIWLARGPRGYFSNITKADSNGLFQYKLLAEPGKNSIRVFEETYADVYSNVTPFTFSYLDPIISWDSIAIKAISNASLPPAEAARDLAILHAAQYDAVAAIQAPQAAYQVHVAAPKGASAYAAADSAALTVLDSLLKVQSAAFTSAETAALSALPNNLATTEGTAVGVEVANATLANRANDGSSANVTYVPTNIPGQWRPTPPGYGAAVDPQFARVTPFELASSSEFRPTAPPSVGSLLYDQALSQVASLGRSTSTSRTAAQTLTANFWSDPPGSITDPGHWNSIAEQVALNRKGTLFQDARTFAQLDFALADAGIAASDAKYTFTTWRPISAIQQTDPTWTSEVPTPASPSYVSDTAAYSTAAADILAANFGASSSFRDLTYATQYGITRFYPSFAAAASEASTSTILGGTQFSFDVSAGQTLGHQVGQTVLAKFPTVKLK